MSARPTPLAFAFATLAAWTLLLAILSARMELLLAAVPMLMVFASARPVGDLESLEIDREASRTHLHQDEELTFTITVRSQIDFAALAIFEPTPDRLALIRGCSHRLVSLTRSRILRWKRRFSGRARGRIEVGALYMRAWDRSGLSAIEARSSEAVAVRVYPAIDHLPILPRPPHTQLFFGDHASRTLGEGIEPAELRPFAQGDRIRRVNWPASLRRQRLFVTQHHEERNADLVILLDSLSEVGRLSATSLDYTIRAAASIGASYLARRDRVGFIEYGGYLRWLRPSGGRRQAMRLLDALLPAEVFFTYLGKDLGLLPRRVLPPQAMVIAVSPLIDARFLRALEDLAARGFDLVVVNVSPTALIQACTEDSAAARLALRIWSIERRSLLEQLGRRGILVVDWPCQSPLAPVVAQASRRHGRLAIRP